LATLHFLVGAAFLALGGAIQLLSLVSLRFAGLLPLNYGMLEPMANLTLMFGFATISLVGGIYYVLPRLTGTKIRPQGLAGFGLLATTGMVLAGLLVLFAGLGNGIQPLGLPSWVDIPLLLAISIPLVVTVATIRRRVEERSFVTIWFALGGVIWLPMLYLAHLLNELPGISSVTTAYSETFFSAGFVTMFVVTVGSGLVYYTVVKELDVPLASRQLALVGFWSLGFAAAWWGAAQLLFGPTPGWVAGVSAALGLAFPLGALANAANVSLTLEGSWSGMYDRPGSLSGVVGLYLTVGVAIVAALAGFRSIGAVAAQTPFWEAIEYAALGGIAVLFVASVGYSALPRLVGRRLESIPKARRFIRLILTGAVGVLVTMGAAGIVSGYAWLGGSNSATYIDAGEGWGAGVAGTHDALMLLAVIFGFVLFLGQLGFVNVMFGTLSRGKAIPQEVLVPKDPGDE
jgi:cytochrome c oxidase cbb3-type subunit 1/cytochrome c oxidase cbb3-type subunit I/II